MKQNRQSILSVVVWLLIVAIASGGGIFERVISSFTDAQATVEEDTNMTTNYYETNIVVKEDGSYEVKELIDVSFDSYRHGIYRYIPYVGVSQYLNDSNEMEKKPYYAKISLLDTNFECEESLENGNKMLRFGTEYDLTYGERYEFTYTIEPRFDDSDYTNAYDNIFPTNWTNSIPAGSKFTITFPKGYDLSKLYFYYGAYGETKDANDIMTIQTDENSIEGTLKTSLALGEGLTFFENMGDGYFTGIKTMMPYKIALVILCIVVLLIVVVMFLIWGRDEKIIPSIQYYPPEGLDSAGVGYVVDGVVDNKDLISLIVYWADKGFLIIEDKGEDNVNLIMKSALPADAPEYQKMLYRKIFANAQETNGYRQVNMDKLQYKCVDTMNQAKGVLKNYFANDLKGSIYSSGSRVARVIATFLSVVPFAAFAFSTSVLTNAGAIMLFLGIVCVVGYFVSVLMFNNTVDRWYANSRKKQKLSMIRSIGICMISIALYSGVLVSKILKHEVINFGWNLALMILASIIMIILTGFMKKRSKECVEWMGRLAGLRDFIETAELDRMQAMANENPEWFYHVLPYAYVMGISDVFMNKFESLSIPAPDWYVNTTTRGDIFDMMMLRHFMYHNMSYMEKTMITPKPSQPSSGSGGFGGGGGGFSGGGGGFSGGGFGGGGGGSW